MNPRNFLAELKRRNVYRIAVAYAVVAWLLIQVATQVFPILEIPNWAIRLVVMLIAIGFPIALIIAWAFELTPEGIKRTDRVKQPTRNRVWFYVVAVAGAISISLFFLGRYTGSSRQSASANAGAESVNATSNKSIAVLPFENLSRDPNNAYFAEGIQEETLTRLARIADLKVISRTSTQQYQSKPGNLSDIAKQLGVANILEGSVQKAGDSVRVNVQLIQAATDSHLWTDTYDRKLIDTFSVESEIAKAIAEQLQAKLTGREQEALSIKPTNNAEAYDAYLRGLAFNARSGDSILNAQKAVSFYKRSVQLDPNFAVAWARLSRAQSFLYFNGLAIVRDAAQQAVNAAEKLQPNSPEIILAKGYYEYWVLRDYESAKATFELVRKVLLGSSDVPAALARIARREGQWDKSTAYFEQAITLDPRNSDLLADCASTYSAIRQFPMARKMYDRALDIEPNDPDLMAAKAWTYQAEGELEQAGKLLASIDAATAPENASVTKSTQLVLERRYEEAIRFLKIRISEFRDISESEKEEDQASIALIQRFADDVAGASATAREAQQSLEALSRNDPNNPGWPWSLSRAYAALGEKNAALKEAERAVTLLPSSKDAVGGPAAEENLAAIEAAIGEKDRAIQRLEHLLHVPYSLIGPPITPALLRLDPSWDGLRGDPRFQKLCEQKRASK